MKNRKFGFTLGEVLVCITIIGIIMAISMKTIKIIKTSYTTLTYHEYINIKQIAAEMIAGDRPYEEGTGAITTTMLTQGGPRTVITEDDQLFCSQLIDMAAAAGHKRCGENELFTAQYDTEPHLTLSTNDWNNPTFTATSGRRYYLAKRVAAPNNVSENFGYRVMAVDLNGTQAPNISKVSGSLVPDIVTFVILDTGEIFPVGVAADNIQTTKKGKVETILYLNSKVKGYYYIDRERTTGIPEDCYVKSSTANEQVCNYAMVYVPNHTQDATNTLSFYSYRQAYCASLGDKTSLFNGYCTGLAKESLCPPSTNDQQFDVCRVENVKPAFRFNF